MVTVLSDSRRVIKKLFLLLPSASAVQEIMFTVAFPHCIVVLTSAFNISCSIRNTDAGSLPCSGDRRVSPPSESMDSCQMLLSGALGYLTAAPQKSDFPK